MNVIANVIEQFDRWLILTINGTHTPFLDKLMWMVSQTAPWLPFYAAIITMLALCYRKQFWRVFLLFFLLVTFADIFSSGVIKPLIARPRPTHEPTLEGLLRMFPKPGGGYYYGGTYGFLSSHAANTTSIGLLFYHFISPFIKRRKALAVFLVGYVCVVCYSRMYVGAHYPTDVLSGILFALAICLPFISNKRVDLHPNINPKKIQYVKIF
ncbi:MAG: phosphatase PAP2 family protein [Bacteroidales bacterium]|nr:phosphatase PAP2 family protein [Bacteroidales bacterium]